MILLGHERLLAQPDLYEIMKGHHAIFRTNAQAAGSAKKASTRRTYVGFRLGHHFAVEIEEIREIINHPGALMRPPGAPGHVSGMFNLRGEMVAVIDTRALYAMPASEENASKILIVESGGRKVGLTVDAVENIFSFSEEEKLLLPPILYPQDTECFSEDIEEAVEVHTSEHGKRAMMILKLRTLVGRILKAA